MIKIVLMTEKHLRDVAHIEDLSFSLPWSERSLAHLLEGENFGVVALDGDVAIAYGGMTCVLDEGSVTNVATHPDYRRRGIGRLVLDRMLSEAEERGISTVFLEVRQSNGAARRLYTSRGFSECGIRKGFYTSPVENAIQMAYYLNEDSEGKK